MDVVGSEAGTCKMGPDSDEMAVVDPMLRVCSDFKRLPFLLDLNLKNRSQSSS